MRACDLWRTTVESVYWISKEISEIKELNLRPCFKQTNIWEPIQCMQSYVECVSTSQDKVKLWYTFLC